MLSAVFSEANGGESTTAHLSWKIIQNFDKKKIIMSTINNQHQLGPNQSLSSNVSVNTMATRIQQYADASQPINSALMLAAGLVQADLDNQSNPLTGGVYQPPKKDIRYYVLPAGINEQTRALILVQLLSHLNEGDCSQQEIEAWIWTILELCHPSLPKKIISSTTNYLPAPIEFNSTELNWLCSGGLPARKAKYKSDNNLSDTDDIPENAELPAIEAPEFQLFSEVKYDPNLIHKSNWFVAVGAAGVLFFAIGKPPSALNLSAFNERRQLAVRNKGGVTSSSDDMITESDLPALEAYIAIKGYYDMRPDLKQLITKEFIRWTKINGTMEQESFATHMKLWQRIGLTHVDLITQMLYNYGPELRQIAPLQHEISMFQVQLDEWLSNPEQDKVYVKVIYGDKNTSLPSRNYPQLLALARQLAILRDPKFSQYADRFQPSPYYNKLIELCQAANKLIATAVKQQQAPDLLSGLFTQPSLPVVDPLVEKNEPSSSKSGN